MADTTVTFTQENLNALEAAIATGTRDVYYGDKRVSYRSLDEMLRIRNLMRDSLGLNDTRSRRKLATHDKGL